MKAARYLMVALLSMGAVFMVGCGDDENKLSNADRACLKLLQMGQQCAPGAGAGSGTATVTATQTITVTNTVVK